MRRPLAGHYGPMTDPVYMVTGGYGLAGGLQGQQQQRAGARAASSGLGNPMSPMLSDGIHTSAAQSVCPCVLTHSASKPTAWS